MAREERRSKRGALLMLTISVGHSDFQTRRLWLSTEEVRPGPEIHYPFGTPGTLQETRRR
jgi:hypothetical protein